MLKIYSSDSYGGLRLLSDSATEVFRALRAFHDLYAASIPMSATQRLHDFIERFNSHFESNPTSNALFEVAQFRLTALRVLQSEVGYLLSDLEVVARSLVDRAFIHLQRAIIADPVIRETWQRAFAEGEPACEKLGAAHLLLHGIWAFKATAEGERTDLVLGHVFEMDASIERASEALVLTEWKLVDSPTDAASKSDQAFKQAKLYGSGSLAGFELATRRYLVLVSKPRLQNVPAERFDSNVTYQKR
jgi:hypothetical protein